MKRRINLLKNSGSPSKFGALNTRAKRYATMIGVFLFVVILVVTAIQSVRNQEKEQLLGQKEQYLKFFIANKNAEANLIFFSQKKNLLNTYLENDVRFLPYYAILQKSLDEASSGAKLNKMQIDKSKKTQFVVDFDSYDAMYKFMRYVESDGFIKNFAQLVLKQLTLQQDLQKSYQLNFEGTFKPLNDLPQ